MGSSMVTMWQARVRLMVSTMAAMVVDLPDPVGPVTRIRPLGLCRTPAITSGIPNSVGVGIRIGMRRSDSEHWPRW